MTPADPYFHRKVALRAGGRRLELATSQELFSSHQVDRGSRLLLRVVADVLAGALTPRAVLDVGCGYGPLGLGLRAMGSHRAVLVDRDALAVRYAARNAEANGLDAVETHGSLGYDDVEGAFGVVVANVPGHASSATLRHFVAGAARVLAPDGVVGLVAVTPLADAVGETLATAGAHTERRVDDRGHTVWIARFDGARPEESPGAPRLDMYRRGRVAMDAGGRRWTAETAEGVPEFERLSHHTTALLRHLATATQERADSIGVWNPGQGHVPIFLAGQLDPRSLVLADRDLLALRYAEANLGTNDVRPPATALVHDAGWQSWTGGGFDLVVDMLRRSEPAPAAAERIVHARSLLERGGSVVVAGPGSSVPRVEAALGDSGVRTRRIAARRSGLLRVAG